jgi:TRAP-type C4-dicarboxylate transport system permease small subunit
MIGEPVRALKALRLFELSVAALAVVLLVLCSVAIILLRLTATSAWSVGAVDTLSQYPSHLMLIAAILGGSLALTRGETLKIEVFNNILPEKSRQLVARLVAVIALLFFCVFIALIIRYLGVDYRAHVAFIYLPLMGIILVKLALLAFSRG